MDRSGLRLFGILVGAQALHSVEEYRYALWKSLAPARFVSSLVSTDPRFGFAVVNLVIVFALWCWRGSLRRNRGYAAALAGFWIVLELANGAGHLVLAASAGAYFPGVYTAPLLLVSAGVLAIHMRQSSTAS